MYADDEKKIINFMFTTIPLLMLTMLCMADTIEYIINMCFTYIHTYMRERAPIFAMMYDKKQNSRKEKLCEIFYLQASLPFSIYEYLNLSHFQQDKQGRRICRCCCCYYVVSCRCCLNT